MNRQSAGIVLCMFLNVVFVATAYAENDMRCGAEEAFNDFLRGEKRIRPPSGPKYVYSPHFIIHFDTVGIHACTREYAESTAVYAEFSWAKGVGGLGFAAPPPDYGGPDSRYDMYVRNMSLYGNIWFETPYPDPYPFGYTSYVAVRNGLSWGDLCCTVAHEFHHGCQARYSHQYNWWYDNVAMWMEDVCYDDVNYYLWCLSQSPNPLADPHLSINNTVNRYEYAGQIWAMFLEEYYGLSCLRLIWEEIGQVGGHNVLSAINSVLGYYGSDLKTALAHYAIWRYFTGDRADTAGYFCESHLMPTSYVDPSRQHYGPASGNQGIHYPGGPGGTSFIEFYTTPDYLLKNAIVGSASAEWRVYSVGYSPAGYRHYMMDNVDYWSVVPTTEHDTIVLIPTVTCTTSTFTFDYSGVAISLVPTPPNDPDLEISSILSPTDTVCGCGMITPYAMRYNNATSTSVDTSWISFYIGDWYGDSREIGPLNPGQTDTVSFADWVPVERKSLGVRCVGGGSFDVDITNNWCDTSVFRPLIDFEVLEILSPRGVVVQNEAVTPSVMVQNNGTEGNTVSVCFSVDDYIDTNSIYLEPDSSGNLLFDDWTPSQLEVCTTSCLITTIDERPANDIIIGEVLVDTVPFAVRETGVSDILQLWMKVYPTPFHQYTDIRCQITDDRQNYELRIYDIAGRVVSDLSEQTSIVGYQLSVKWDGTDQSDRPLASGVYFVRLETGDYSATEKLLLVR